MSASKKSIRYSLAALCAGVLFIAIAVAAPDTEPAAPSLTQDAIAEQLGWVESNINNCGGYYLEEPFIYPMNVDNKNLVEITSNQTLFSQHGTSILKGKVTANRFGQQITSNKAYLYRDPQTGKLSAMDMIGNVHLREPNTLIVGKRGHYDFNTKTKSLIDIIYRTSFTNSREIAGPSNVTPENTQRARKIVALTAWGKAGSVSQAEPKIYELQRASYTTCPPINPAWQVKASHIVLNKESGRGYATNARIYVKQIPVFYTPYINFPIDSRRKSGFLMPTFGLGSGSNEWGPYFLAPFYWNMAPNYDMTITTGILSNRGVQLNDQFRYLTAYNEGQFSISVLPGDKAFAAFQETQEGEFADTNNTILQAELNRLRSASTTRRAFYWRDDAWFNDHWSSHIDFNYAGDDYYLKNFGSNLNEITKNQLLQEGDLYYKSENWNFTGRLQTYQTLHPIDDTFFTNSYRRFPQLILNGDYPDRALGLEYFINNEFTRFEFLKTPGTDTQMPVGNRLNVQPGISLPLSWPYLVFNPRIQLAMTQYQLNQSTDTNSIDATRRVIPIFDLISNVALVRDVKLFNYAFQQTLEPQIYYTYIPYRNQSSIPKFDTTVNTLTYDQLFNYNRFSGIDRIGDANQIGVGITTRIIDQDSGIEKVRLGIGEIVYFANRRVTLCNSLMGPEGCIDYPDNPNNKRRLSPISGLMDFNIIPNWLIHTDVIWNPITKQLDNSLLALHYQTDDFHAFTLSYNYAFNADAVGGIVSTQSQNNLKVTDASFIWPVPFFRDVSAVGRWSQNWNRRHLQNMLVGLQYDTCCWAARLVGGRAFVSLDPTNNYKTLYNNEFYIQFSLKGLGDIGSGNPNGVLSSINGYKPHFGRDF